MTKQEVIQRLCKLSTLAADAVYEETGVSKSHDCFCGDNPLPNPNYQFEEDVMQFIVEAVHRAWARSILTSKAKKEAKE